MAKLNTALLIRRIGDQLPVPQCQMAGCKGTQTLDAVSCCCHRLEREAKWGTSSVWISLDVEAAFDSMSHWSVGSFLLEVCSDEVAWESLRLFQALRNPQLCFELFGHQWSMHQQQGIQQGSSFSAQLFAAVLARRMQQLFDVWRARGEQCLHDTYGLVYIDDILLNFFNASDARRLLPEVAQALAELGLKLHEGKSQAMTSPSVFDAVVSSLPSGSMLARFTWDTSIVYLKRRLSHPNSAADTTNLLLRQCQRSFHGAWQSLQSIVCRIGWCNIVLVLQVMQRYIASTWLWLAPLLYPLVQYVRQVDIWQCTYTLNALNLYIPDAAPQSLAFALLRLRRRAVQSVVLTDRRWRWADSWLMRKWNYFGHVLRMHASHPARLSFFRCQGEQQQRAPWSSSLRWVKVMVQRLVGGSSLPTDKALAVRAADRDWWAAKAPQVLEWYAYCPKIGTSNSWPCLRKLYSLCPSWLQLVYVQPLPEGFCLHWLSVEEGWMNLAVVEGSDACNSWATTLQHICMLSAPLVIQLHLGEELADSLLLFLHHLATRMWQQFQRILLFDILTALQISFLNSRVLSHGDMGA